MKYILLILFFGFISCSSVTKQEDKNVSCEQQNESMVEILNMKSLLWLKSLDYFYLKQGREYESMDNYIR